MKVKEYLVATCFLNVLIVVKCQRGGARTELQAMLDLNDITALETSSKDASLPNLFAHGANMKGSEVSVRPSLRQGTHSSRTAEDVKTNVNNVENIPPPSARPSPILIPFSINGNGVKNSMDTASPDVVLIETKNSIIDVRRPPSLKQNSLDLSPNQKIKMHSAAELQDEISPQAEESRLLNNFIGTLLPQARATSDNVNSRSFGLSLRNRNMVQLVNEIGRNNVRVPRQVASTKKPVTEAPIRGIIVDNTLLQPSIETDFVNIPQSISSHQQSLEHSHPHGVPSDISSITGLGDTNNLFDTPGTPEYELISPEMLDALSTGNINGTDIPPWLKETNVVPLTLSPNNIHFNQPDTLNGMNAMLGISAFPGDTVSNVKPEANQIGEKEIEQLINNVISSVDVHPVPATGIPVQMVSQPKNNISWSMHSQDQSLIDSSQTLGNIPAFPTPLLRNVHSPASSSNGLPRPNDQNPSNVRRQLPSRIPSVRTPNNNQRQPSKEGAQNIVTNSDSAIRRGNFDANNFGRMTRDRQQLSNQNGMIAPSAPGITQPNFRRNVQTARRHVNNRNQRLTNQPSDQNLFGIRQGVRAIAQNLFGANGAIPLSSVNEINADQPSSITANRGNQDITQSKEPLSNIGGATEENRVLPNTNPQVTPISARQAVRRIQQARALQDRQQPTQGNTFNDLSVSVIPVGLSDSNNPEANLLGQAPSNQQRNQNILQNVGNREAFSRLLQSIDLPKDPQTGQAVPILIYPIGFDNATSRSQVSAMSSQIASVLSQVLSGARGQRPRQVNSNTQPTRRIPSPARRNVNNQRSINPRQVNSPQRLAQLGLRPEQINVVQAIVRALQSGLSLSAAQRQRLIAGLNSILRTRLQSAGSSSAIPGSPPVDAPSSRTPGRILRQSQFSGQQQAQRVPNQQRSPEIQGSQPIFRQNAQQQSNTVPNFQGPPTNALNTRGRRMVF